MALTVDGTSVLPRVRGANTWVLAIGPCVSAVVILASSATGVTGASTTIPSWVVVAALLALGLGIPHGAVDHLTLANPPTHRIRLALAYLAIAGTATAIIVIWPGPAFVAVLLMSLWHFGSGDVEAYAELTGSARLTGVSRTVDILARGAAPLLLPLTSAGASESLAQLEPGLGAILTPTVCALLRGLTVGLVVVAVGRQLALRNYRTAIDVVALTSLGLVATPFIVFAVYFAAWHAVRHTARLAMDDQGVVTAQRLWRVFIAGLPALGAFVVGVAVVWVGLGRGSSVAQWLWWGLAAVWGLTVPHMIAVSRFDRARRRTLSDRADRHTHSVPGAHA